MQLTARPDPAARPDLPTGTTELPLTTGRTALLHVPTGAVTGLVVVLHGAGGSAVSALSLVDRGSRPGAPVLLAPASAGSTWSGLFGGADPDLAAIDRALQEIFSRYPCRPDRVGVAGFSDGASYALTLGLANGTLFRKVVAFSPGFEAAPRRSGRPAFFVTHGVHDDVLPIDRTSRRIVPWLRRNGYQVSYAEFDGGHVVPTSYVKQATTWLAGPPDQGEEPGRSPDIG